MSRIWFVKNEQDVETGSSMVYNLTSKNNKSNIKTDVENLWRMFSQPSLSKVVEDLLLVGIAVFTTDKKIPRKTAKDGWSRELNLHIPVLEIDKWNSVKNELEETLSFLSGDTWNISFYHTVERLRGDKVNKKYNIKDPTSFDCVSLFSGGVDSFCGALTLMESSRNPLFVGFKEYPLLLRRQKTLIESIQDKYSEQNMDFIQFNVSPRRPSNVGSNNTFGESTSRSRSFLFITGAIAVASMIGKDTPVYIPENGFIGINVPLTQSRSGSCSTRTTHPYFIGLVNQLLIQIGIGNKVENFYSTKSKGEIISEHQNNNVFKDNYKETLSCSHPCQSRYDGISPPLNCGYCYPCLIRRASLVVNGFTDDHYNSNYSLDKEFIETNLKIDGKASDLKAVLYTIRRFVDNEQDSVFIRKLLRQPGPLSSAELDSYESVYRTSIEELISMVEYEDGKNNGELKKYMGLKEQHAELR
ncbi:Qat anti-phage system QueC-like protein QatC [Cytobacillus gottheilii]|uniref:Qat anti-phage system QueC-like protein QatC n=1 Tax=Cytobacillus gottheilii TaxID=859144 RepID=UPI00082C8043|nr:Qat anti-phage system QueC-like protein QatC [Cytobacillus gottheilii]